MEIFIIFICLNKIVFLAAVSWHKKIFWFEKLNFCLYDQTRLIKWIKAFSWTVLLILQHFLDEFTKWILFIWIKKMIWLHQTHVLQDHPNILFLCIQIYKNNILRKFSTLHEYFETKMNLKYTKKLESTIKNQFYPHKKYFSYGKCFLQKI